MAPKKKPNTPWRKKLEKVKEAQVVDIPEQMQNSFGEGTMLIPRPVDVDATIRTIRKGKLATNNLIRSHLAKEYEVDISCPMSTCIFVRIAAETAEEDRSLGKKRITPYWRVLKDDGSLNLRYPGGVEAQAKILKKEGHEILPAIDKQPPKVANFEKKLMKM